MKVKLILVLSISLLAFNSTHGQGYVTNVTGVGTTAAPFLEIEIGPRATGMGGAFTAVANDATAIYWNPAGIARLVANEAILIHTKWLAGISFDFVAGIFPLGEYGVIGVSGTSLSMGEMEVRTIAQQEGTGERFGANSLALKLSYATNLTDRFSIGFNGKYIQENMWHMNASAVAIDIGTLFTTQFNDMRIGMSISNFGTDMKLAGRDAMVYHDIAPDIIGNNDKTIAFLGTDPWSLPLTFRAGVAIDIIRDPKNYLTVAVDAVHPNDNSEYLNLGFEYVLNDLLSLRCGYCSLFKRNSEEGFTMGLGIKTKLDIGAALKVDYAYADFGRLVNAHRFSIGVEF